MAIDVSARGIALRALRRSPREKIAIAVIGQSNERGNVLLTDQAAYPRAFASARNPAEQVPIGPSLSLLGGWWHHVYDALWDWGYDPQLVNGAIGSASFLTQIPGFLQQRSNSASVYCVRRASAGPGDRGDAGDVVTVGGRVFRCTAGGNNRFAVNSGPQRDLAGNVTYLDYISGLNTGGATAASAPDFTAAAIGGTVTDGAITWTRENEAFYVGAINNVLTDSAGAMHGRGFDPLGLLQRTFEELQRVRGATRKIVYIANGQTDLGIGPVTYGAALQSIALFFLRRGCEVMIGLTMFSPGASLATTASYDNLSTGVSSAITALQALYPGKVWAGANLYQLMGTSGPMGGANFTGAIASNVLTVSAMGAGGSNIEIGHTIARTDGTFAGTVASLGTGTGQTGTYVLTGGVATGAVAMRSVGAFLQPLDGVHINGRGAVGPASGAVQPCGYHIANVLKAVLPSRAIS
ncbi:MAG TPA: hypothetical protein VF463_09120 [Sphingobium sp.]